MSLYSAFLRKTALPMILRRYHRHSALKHREFFASSQYWSRQELLDYQWRRLMELLRHAYATCPYYTRVFNERGLTPDSFRSVDDISKLPILTRSDVFAHVDSLISTRYQRSDLLAFYTGGTTGQQARLYLDQECYNIKQGLTWRHEAWMGCEPCDPIAFFWPAHMDIPDHESWKSRFVRRHVQRTEMLHGGSINETLARLLAQQLVSFRPKYLKVFPASFAAFVEAAVSAGLPLPKVRGIMATGEVLYPNHRKLFEAVFACPIYDMYGSREAGNTASECSDHRGMHIALETSALEFVRDRRPVPFGEEGEILITDLDNYGMPLIRYQINDFGIPLAGECSCGRALPLMAAAVGRVQDCFYGPDGTRHSGNVLGFHLTSAHDDITVGSMQFVQKSLTHFLVRITNKPTLTEETFRYIERHMKEIIGPGITIAFEVVESIPRERSGKTRYVISEVLPPNRDPQSDSQG